MPLPPPGLPHSLRAGADAVRNDAHSPLSRKLHRIHQLSPEAILAVTNLPMQVVDIKENQDIVREADRPSRCFLVLMGFTASYKIVAAGNRQILAFQVAGDVPDLQSVHLDYLDSSIATITPCTVGFIHHKAIKSLYRQFPEVGDALWRLTLIEVAVFREWMSNIGRREAHSRLCHLFCEIYTRLRSADQAVDGTCAFPFSQSELADATGLSAVHINRTLKQVRGDGLITLENGTLHIPDWDRLQQAGDFDPSYLHLNPLRH